MPDNRAMTKPLIGLTTYRTPGQMTIYDGELAVLPAQYVSGVERAGGIVTLVPPQELSGEDAHRILDSLDALIIT